MEKASLNNPIYEYFNGMYNRDGTVDSAGIVVICTVDSALFNTNCTVCSAIYW